MRNARAVGARLQADTRNGSERGVPAGRRRCMGGASGTGMTGATGVAGRSGVEASGEYLREWRCATINIRGLNQPAQRAVLADWAHSQHIDHLMIQDTGGGPRRIQLVLVFRDPAGDRDPSGDDDGSAARRSGSW